MFISISSLLCAVVVNADLMGGHTEVNPNHFESKIFNGKPSYREEYKYMASLQLNGSHVCSSGMFQMGFLLTTVECAWYVGVGIKVENRRATAVFADPNLKDGQRINIFRIAYCGNCKTNDFEIGVIMLANKSHHVDAQVLTLYPQKLDLRIHGSGATICGWDTEDSPEQLDVNNTNYSDKLHCMTIKLYPEGLCYKSIPYGNYKRKLLCGKSDNLGQIENVKDVGSPITKFIYNDDQDENVILGVTILPHVHGNATFHRFIRISLVFDHIQEMVKELESVTETDNACFQKYQGLMEKSNKRRKHQ